MATFTSDIGYLLLERGRRGKVSRISSRVLAPLFRGRKAYQVGGAFRYDGDVVEIFSLASPLRLSCCGLEDAVTMQPMMRTATLFFLHCCGLGSPRSVG